MKDLPPGHEHDGPRALGGAGERDGSAGEDSPALWIFGYGSLLWRPDFPHRERHSAWIDGWARRFWQGSTDHRGVPGAPGRVVTLVRSPAERCWGAVFRVEPAYRDAVLAYLDHREKGGYERLTVAAHFASASRVVPALAYRATETNPNFLGPATLETIARQIVAASGPSGPNRDYVLALDDAVRRLGGEDAHLADVARAVAARAL